MRFEMLLKDRLYQLFAIASVVVAIAMVMIGAILFIEEPIARADNSVLAISQNAGAVIQTLAQAPSTKRLEATVYRDPNCGCCEKWMKHLRDNGFQISEVQQADMEPVKQQYNVPEELSSCHTAIINGAVIEGHVPVEDIKRFLAENVDAAGLAVPGMPLGSPGMESEDTQESFTVFSFDQQGTPEVFNEYTF
jgi:hypothetical protein